MAFMERNDELVVEFEGEGAFGDPDLFGKQLEEAVQHKDIRVEQVDTAQTTYRLHVPYVT